MRIVDEHVGRLIREAEPRSVRLYREPLLVGDSERYIARFSNISITVSPSDRAALLASGVAHEDDDD